jgi:hypothetical protein
MCPPFDSTQLRDVLSKRDECLRTLRTGVWTKPELVAELDVARSTVDRAIRELEVVSCIEPVDGGYRATPTGRLALGEYDEYVEATSSVANASSYLGRLPSDAPVDSAIVRGASITLAEPHAPEVALEPCIDLLDRATSLQALVPVALSVLPRRLLPHVDGDDLTVELVAQANVIESLPALDGGGGGRFLAHDAVTVHSTDAALPYLLWVIETTGTEVAGITACTDGRVDGILVNEREQAVRWARDEYAAYRERATLHDR